MTDKFYTTEEAADEVGVSRQTLQTWIAEDKIQAPRLVGTTRIWTEAQVAELRRIDHKGWGRKKKSKKKASK
jgi:excisionase family DNA binding protein